MYSQGQDKAKVGRVAIDIHGKSYRLRFTYPEKITHSFTIARATPEGWVTAIKASQLINRDIDMGDFDDSYARYSPKHARRLEKQQAQKTNKQYDLLEIWEEYKIVKSEQIAESTKRGLWKDCDRSLSSTPKELLKLDKAHEFLVNLQSRYAVSTIATLFRSCLKPAANTAVTRKLIETNPYDGLVIPRPVKKPPECFETSEVKAILDAFSSNEFNNKKSRYQHSHYFKLVSFLALTGCRPSEAHALTWNDIKIKGGRYYILFNKAYVKGVIKPPKTHEIRIFPMNQQLQDLLGSIPKKQTNNNLIFPGVEGRYVTQNNFREKNWKPVLKGLIRQNKVEKYLKPYALRHSFITRMVREGVDIKTVATLSGNSVKTIIDNYLASRKDFDLPEL